MIESRNFRVAIYACTRYYDIRPSPVLVRVIRKFTREQ
jgi:hypothetical protein